MTTSPALARAAEIVADRCWWHLAVPVAPPSLARAVVSAALHDPNDTDWLARVVDAHSPFTITSSPPVRCECGRWVENHSRHVADAVRAAILGPTGG